MRLAPGKIAPGALGHNHIIRLRGNISLCIRIIISSHNHIVFSDDYLMHLSCFVKVRKEKWGR